MTLQALALAGVLAACTRGEAPWSAPFTDSSGAQGLVAGQGAGTRSRFISRIDGEITGVFREEIVPGSEQTIVQTGHGPGTDQCSLLVLDDEGLVRMRHRVSGDTPAGHRMLEPGCATLRPLDWGGRRWLLVTTGGMSQPYSIEVLEIDPSRGLDGLVPRLRIWTDGTPHAPIVAEGLIAFRSLANSFRDDRTDDVYPVAVCVVSMDEAIEASRSDTSREVVVPTGTRGPEVADPGRGYLRYFLLNERSRWHFEIPFEIAITGKTVRATRQDGLSYVLDPFTPAIGTAANEEFLELQARQGEADAGRRVEAALLEARAKSRMIAPAVR